MHLLGQSWGVMLAIQYLIEEKPAGVKSAILSSGLPASWLWGKEQHRLIKFMSREDQKAIARAEAANDYSSQDYLKANDHFMALHCAGPVTPDSPECLRRPKKAGEESYITAWGPNEYTPLGTLKDFDYIDRLGEISTPCLIMSGTNAPVTCALWSKPTAIATCSPSGSVASTKRPSLTCVELLPIA